LTNIPTILFSALLFLLFSAGACAALSSMSAPAMDASGKGIITTTQARLVSDSAVGAGGGGGGGVFLDIKPFSSVETQQSAETAAKLAAREAGTDFAGKALLYSVKADAEIIDGPSGGVAFALLAYAEFTGKKLRSDLAVTGSIMQDGSAGKVGGVLQKLEAVHDAGLRVFLIPLGQGVQQGIDLTQLGAQWGISVIEVANFDEAAAIAFTPTGSAVQAPKREKKPLVLPEIEAPPASEFMRELAKNEAESLAETEATLSRRAAVGDNASRLVAASLRASLNLSRELLEKNYFYSAANAAFVAEVTAQAFLASNYSQREFADAVRALASQLNESFAQKFGGGAGELREGNWEKLVGAQTRYAWARAKANELEEKLPLAAKPLPFLEDLASARAWLEASRSIAESVEVSGGANAEFNEFKARGEARALIARANASLASSYDADGEWHLGVAQNSFAEGGYAAAVFDGCFALGFSQARAKAENAFGEDFAALFENASALPRFKTAWAQLYYAHSLYNLAEANRTGDFAFSLNALKLQELSRCLEDSFDRVKKAIASNESAGEIQPSPSSTPSASRNASIEVVYSIEKTGGGEAKNYLLIAFVVLVALVVISVFFVRARLRERAPPLSDEERERRLDEALLRGRISESTYERLRAKYAWRSGGVTKGEGLKRSERGELSARSALPLSGSRTRAPRRRAR
jgi:predicted S18 family serine protease